jgi:hypothetical protein
MKQATVGSPTLLMLSGVGPKEHLTKLKVYLLILLGILLVYFARYWHYIVYPIKSMASDYPLCIFNLMS